MLYDRDIREPLFDFLETLYGKIRILEEKELEYATECYPDADFAFTTQGVECLKK